MYILKKTCRFLSGSLVITWPTNKLQIGTFLSEYSLIFLVGRLWDSYAKEK